MSVRRRGGFWVLMIWKVFSLFGSRFRKMSTLLKVGFLFFFMVSIRFFGFIVDKVTRVLFFRRIWVSVGK